MKSYSLRECNTRKKALFLDSLKTGPYIFWSTYRDLHSNPMNGCYLFLFFLPFPLFNDPKVEVKL